MLRSTITFFLALSVPSLGCFSQCLANEFIEVSNISGFGASVESALNNSFDNAVREALGTVITSKTEIENDELIEDRITVVSGGFIEKFQQVGEPIRKNGVYEVRINAQISRTKLDGALIANDIPLVGDGGFEGNQLYAKAITRIKERRNATRMITELFHAHVHNQTSHVKERADYDDQANLLRTDIRFEREEGVWDKFVDNGIAILGRIALAETLVVSNTGGIKGEFLTGQFVCTISQRLGPLNKPSLRQQIPAFTKAINASSPLTHKFQTSKARTWILWLEQQSSPKATQWKGFLLDTDPSYLFPFLDNSYAHNTSFFDENMKLLQKDSFLLDLGLEKPNSPNERISLGILAVSTDGLELRTSKSLSVLYDPEVALTDFSKISADSLNVFKSDGLYPIEYFMRENQAQQSPKLNVFLTKNSVIYTAPDNLGKVVESDYFPNGVIRMLACRNPNKPGVLSNGFQVRREIPFALAQLSKLAEASSQILYDYDEQLAVARLNSLYPNSVGIRLNNDFNVSGLSLAGINLEKPVPFLTALEDLEVLELTGASNVDSFLTNVRHSKQLKNIDLSKTDVSEIGISSLTQLNRLEGLNLDGCLISPAFITELVKLTTLRSLELENTTFENDSFEGITKLKQLSALSLSNIDLTDENLLGHLAQCKSLMNLSLTATKISEEGLNTLKTKLINCKIELHD
jgi:uncharacterized protein YjbI with pentapeptide repeats